MRESPDSLPFSVRESGYARLLLESPDENYFAHGQWICYYVLVINTSVCTEKSHLILNPGCLTLAQTQPSNAWGQDCMVKHD